MTLGAIALRHHTGQLTIESDGKRYCIAFDDGAIVAASSPMAADAIARIALTNHFITSTQVPDITRRLALSPDRDEVDVLGDVVRFSTDQVIKLRHRVVAQRAARTFSLERGEFVLDDRIALPVVPGISVDHRQVIYLGVRTNLAEQRLIDDLRQLGSIFVLKPEAIDDLPRFGFEPSAQPVLEALKLGTSLPELEATYRDLDPRSAQAIIYALVSCTACNIPPRSAPGNVVARTQSSDSAITRKVADKLSGSRTHTASREPSASRTATPPGSRTTTREPSASRTSTPPAGGRTATREPSASRTSTPPGEPRTATREPSASRTSTPPAEGRTTTREPSASRTSTPPAEGRTATREPSASRTSTPPAEGRTATREPSASRTSTPPPVAPVTLGTSPPFAAGTATFSNASTPPADPAQPYVAAKATKPLPGQTISPFASRTNTASPTAYSTAAVPDAGTNTPAATRPKAADPVPSRTTSPPLAPRPVPTRTTTPPAAPTAAAQDPIADARADTEPMTPGDAPQPARPAPRATKAGTPPRPAVPRTPTGDGDIVRSFAEQRTPGFGDQRTPSDQRTPGFGDQRTHGDARTPTDQRTPTDPSLGRAPTGPSTSRVSTDNAAAADQAFKRGELAMKRDQPGEAILEFKAACDLNPQDVDCAAMLAWAKFCAAGDKPAIGAETRKMLERAVFKSHKPERARFYLGRVERMLGRDKEALRHFQEVLDLKPNHAEAASEVRAIEARLQAAAKGPGLFGRKR